MKNLIGNKTMIAVVATALVMFFCGCLAGSVFAGRGSRAAAAVTPATIAPPVEVTRLVKEIAEVTRVVEVPVTVTPTETPRFTPTNTLTPSKTPTITKTPKPTLPPSKTPTPNVARTSAAVTATYMARYSDINYRELRDYPDDHKGELVCVRGRVFNIVDNKTLQMYFAGTYDALYVEFLLSFSKVYENSSIRVCGTVYGTVSFQNTLGGTVTQPALKAAFIP